MGGGDGEVGGWEKGKVEELKVQLHEIFFRLN
jgi:hypothetical protein